MKKPSLLEKSFESRTCTVFLLAVALSAGFYLRFDNLDYWLSHKNQYFTSFGTPVTLGVDSYYYMDIADDLLHGKIENLDEQRHFPVGLSKPTTLPLLSVLMALFSFLSNRPLEWVAVLLPPFLGVLLAIPVYFLGYKLVIDGRVFPGAKKSVSVTEAKLTGFTAALTALLSTPFVVRSSIGSCDTDILNVAFATLCIYLAAGFYTAQTNRQRVQIFALWSGTVLAFLWWWDQLILPPLALAAIPMLPAFFFRRSELGTKVLPYLLVIVSFLVVLVVWKHSSIARIADQFHSLYAYIFGVENSSFFPPLEQLVQEQGDLSYAVLARNVAGNIYLYTMSLAGLLILPFWAGKKFFFLLPLIILNIMAFSAMRFAVFVAPLFGLGVAAVILALLLALRRLHYMRLAAAVPLICLFSWPPTVFSQGYSSAQPLLAPVVYEGMIETAEKTPENSVIWSSWGHGHPLVYYTGRSTIGDGMFHPPYLIYAIKYPFAANNFRLAANWIQFFTVNGDSGLKKVFAQLAGDSENWPDGMDRLRELLGSGVERSKNILRHKYNMQPPEAKVLLAMLFPPARQPIYVFMDYKMVAENWYRTGKWNLKRNSAPPLNTKIPVLDYTLRQAFLSGTTATGAFQVNLQTGALSMVTGQSSRLKAIHINRKEGRLSRTYPGRGIGNNLYLAEEDADKGPLGLIADHHVSNTVMIKLFFERKFDQDFFKPVIARLPFYLVSEVHGEKYSPKNN